MSFFIINASVVNVYKGRDFNSAVVTQALLGESCAVIDKEEKWVKIRQWDNYQGWVNRCQGIFSNHEYGPTLTVLDVSGSVTSFNNGRVIRDLSFGNKIVATQNGNNFQVELPDGQVGTTNAKLGQFGKTPGRNSIVEQARSFLGAPYHWGGISPNGFDCSGYVQTVFKAKGIHLPRDAHQQADFIDLTPIAIDDVKPGDLLFFSDNGYVTHVAISTGGKGIIHAHGWVKEEYLDSKSANSNLLNSLFSIGSITRIL